MRHPKSNPLKAGSTYSIFETDTERPLKDPETGALLGYMVHVLGDVRVEQITNDGMARGTIVDATRAIERGGRIGAEIPQFKDIVPLPSKVDLRGKIVAAFTPIKMFADESFLVLNKGQKDGIAVGNRAFVVRYGDGIVRPMETEHRQNFDFPREVVAELWVVDVRKNASVAWVKEATKEVRVGEAVELHNGH